MLSRPASGVGAPQHDPHRKIVAFHAYLNEVAAVDDALTRQAAAGFEEAGARKFDDGRACRSDVRLNGLRQRVPP